MSGQDKLLEKLICSCTARDSAEELKTYLSTITNIDICDADIGNGGVKVLADALVSNTTITTIAIAIIDTSWNDGSDEDPLWVPSCKGKGIGDEGAKSLADVLTKNTTITDINLSENNIREEGAKALADALAKNTTITNIDLCYNIIGAEGARSLADAFSKNTTITDINLSGNNIREEGAKLLVDALAINTTITTIALPKKSICVESWRALKKKGFSLINLDTILYGGTGSKIDSNNSDMYYNMKIWGRKRNETSGRLPLFTAAARSLTWVDIRQILAVNMPVIYEVDGLTGLPIFMLAAVGPKSNIESVYHLLKEYPSALGPLNNKHQNTSSCPATNKIQDNCYKNKRQKR